MVVDTVTGNIFKGTQTSSVDDGKGTKITTAMSGSINGSKITIVWEKVVYDKELPYGRWCNCNNCSQSSTQIYLNEESIILRMETINCRSCCDGISEYFRSLYIFDTTTQRSIVNRFGTIEQKKDFKSYVDENTPLLIPTINRPPQQVYIHDTIRIHDTMKLGNAISENSSIIPNVFIDRSNKLIETFHVVSKEIKIELFDNADIDGDTVTVYHNNEMIVEKEMLKRKPIVRTIHADAQNRNHSFTMIALNLGNIPPNTALMRITSGKRRFEVTAKADLSENARLDVIYDGD